MMDYFETIEKALPLIERETEENLSLDDPADAFHLSKFYFHRLFTSVMSTTVNQYVLSRRLNRAVGLLKKTDRTITDIAYGLGFGNSASFTRAFRKQYGLTPGPSGGLLMLWKRDRCPRSSGAPSKISMAMSWQIIPCCLLSLDRSQVWCSRLF